MAKDKEANKFKAFKKELGLWSKEFKKEAFELSKTGIEEGIGIAQGKKFKFKKKPKKKKS